MFLPAPPPSRLAKLSFAGVAGFELTFSTRPVLAGCCRFRGVERPLAEGEGVGRRVGCEAKGAAAREGLELPLVSAFAEDDQSKPERSSIKYSLRRVSRFSDYAWSCGRESVMGSGMWRGVYCVFGNVDGRWSSAGMSWQIMRLCAQ